MRARMATGQGARHTMPCALLALRPCFVARVELLWREHRQFPIRLIESAKIVPVRAWRDLQRSHVENGVDRRQVEGQ